MKRILAAVITVCFVLSCHAPFIYAEKEYTVPTYTGTKSEYVTREQAVACFIKAAGREKFKIDIKALDDFSDKDEISFAYIEEMSGAVLGGLIGGYEDKTLRPQSYITRIEALVMLNRALGDVELGSWTNIKFEDTPIWAEEQVERLSSAGIVKGYENGSLGATDLLTPKQINTLCERIVRYTGPCGDYYDYVNSLWLDKTELNGTAYMSDMKSIETKLENQTEGIIYQLYRKHYNDGEEYSKDSDEFRIITAYSAAADQTYRDKIGFLPIQEKLDMIENINDKDTLSAALSDLIKSGFSVFLPIKKDISIYTDDKYALSLAECYDGGLSDVIQKQSVSENNDNTTSDAVKYYTEYIKTLFELCGDKNAEENAFLAGMICEKIARLAKDNLSDTDNLSYVKDNAPKKWQYKEIKESYNRINTDMIFTELAGFIPETLNVYNEGQIKGVASLFGADNAESLKTVKAYLKAAVVDSMALYLTTDCFNALKNYKAMIAGKTTDDDISIPADYAVDITKNLMGWEIGKLYVDMYFPESSKEQIKNLTKDIMAEYEKLIKNCSRLTPKTRNAEIRKLKNISVNAAFPDDFDVYTDKNYPMRTTAEGGSVPEYIMEKSKAEFENYTSEVTCNSLKNGRGEWIIYPYTANAVYSHVANSINIPAGILQAPYFETGATEEENLGGIGFVIAHEISHAFDLNGSNFNEKGILVENKRWSDNDYLSFYNLCDDIEKEYSKISFNGFNIDGKQTLNENMADIAAMTCIISLAKEKRLDLNKVFTSFAKSWRLKSIDDYDKFMIENDIHSPSKVRVNRLLSNFDEFVDCYKVIEGDGMYIPKEQRINIFK